ncbi:hypothetical protein JR316_0001624 [Psilocybe cubensis]|uniref:Uncharacterized protein n=2 Tax=Psilocybe cubensis TaxID=181762 RepID=A0ACB8HAM7_PSICU|nr:hypothetical protein JR316_0001624 [Psilocybe cubensis]KAH9484724.1 hypothetical protein JR316_0001624 [Psilocybe cubensis]
MRSLATQHFDLPDSVTNNFLLKDRGTPVAMLLQGRTSHYRIDEPDANEEYSRLLPSGGHLVHYPDSDGNMKEYTVTIFHQLKCLNIVREAYLNDASQPISRFTRHCMTYLRQSLLCNLNIGLENTVNAAASVSRTYNALCFDWTKVYAEAEKNYQNTRGQSTQ